ncbi:hypothetical protein F0919_14480 [Taibaiella lutea]|uniref:Uncharacterized protein n=1 Tax=Taibaiella lutea TaxID=2608001 RepID=A0A5M6CK69_9BACT|nr:hypothetical protein [Taibaiella lutea]KAA5533735.1 hypothetical protein F0919_14480 [Taibaiella lutea]
MKIRTGILLLLFAVLLGVSLFLNLKQFIRTKADAIKISALAAQQTTHYAPVVTRYIHDSIEHLVVKEIMIASNEDKSGTIGSAYIDTLKRAINIAEKQMDQVTKINASLAAESITLKQSTDNKLYEHHDKWLSLSYYPDSNKFNLHYDVSLNTVRYWKRSWILGSKQYYLDIFSDDPRIKIDNIKRYTIAEPKPKKFGIGLHAGYSFNPVNNQWHPSFGFGLNYNLIRF